MAGENIELTEEEKIIVKKLTELKEEIETYEFFSNPVKTGITLYNGMKKIIEKLESIEKRLENLEKSNGKPTQTN